MFPSHFLAYEFRFDTFQNEGGEMNNYRKGGEIKKMITEDFTALTIIILFISYILINRGMR